MNPIVKVAVVIVKDKKVLLVTGNDKDFFWTPGGKQDPDESLEETVRREILEELNTSVKNIKYYFKYLSRREEDSKPREVHVYTVELEDEPNIGAEIQKFVWISKDDFVNKTIKFQYGVEDHLMPRLIADDIL